MIYNEPALLRFARIAIAKPTPEDMAKAITAYAGQAAAAGLTALHEPGTVKPEWVEMLAKLSNYAADPPERQLLDRHDRGQQALRGARTLAQGTARSKQPLSRSMA